jgi:hypothetical protein
MDQLYLQHPNGFKNYCLCFRSDNKELVVKFRTLCKLELDRKFRWFHQSDHSNYQMFEFWIGREEEIRQECLKIASLMGMKLEEKQY